MTSRSCGSTRVGVMTNTAPVGAFRGAGRPEAAACIERMMDVAAAELGLAPEEIRRRNFIRPDAFPFKTKTGATYDNGDYDLALTEALRIADVESARREQRRRIEAGERRLLGIGLATYVEITGFGGSEYGQVVVHDDGTATVRSGTSSHGQGHATSFSMIASDRLGIPLDDITYEQSDTALIPTGGGTGGSRSLQIGGNAVGKAADELKEKAVELAARMLEAAPDDVVLDDGAFSVVGVPDSRLTWKELAAHAHEHEGGLAVATDYTLPHATFPFGAHVSIVEVDVDTGRVRPVRHIAVDDCGRVLNPLLVAGQQHGGAVQGISQALWEEMVYDDQGTPLTATFVDYAMPTAADTFMLEASNTETPTPVNPLGAKGIGESATIGSTPRSRTPSSTHCATSACGTSTCRAPRAGLAGHPRAGARPLARAAGRLRRRAGVTRSPTTSKLDRAEVSIAASQGLSAAIGAAFLDLPGARTLVACCRGPRTPDDLRRRGRRRRSRPGHRARHHHVRARAQRRREDDHAGDL